MRAEHIGRLSAINRSAAVMCLNFLRRSHYVIAHLEEFLVNLKRSLKFVKLFKDAALKKSRSMSAWARLRMEHACMHSCVQSITAFRSIQSTDVTS